MSRAYAWFTFFVVAKVTILSGIIARKKRKKEVSDIQKKYHTISSKVIILDYKSERDLPVAFLINLHRLFG